MESSTVTLNVRKLRNQYSGYIRIVATMLLILVGKNGNPNDTTVPVVDCIDPYVPPLVPVPPPDNDFLKSAYMSFVVN